MTYASRRGYANRQQARAGKTRALQNLGRVAPSALVMGLIDRFMLGPDFPLDTWLATHETPRMRRAMQKLMDEVPVVNPEAYTPGGA